MDKDRIPLYLDPDLSTELRDYCETHNLSLTSFARRAVIRELARVEDNPGGRQ